MENPTVGPWENVQVVPWAAALGTLLVDSMDTQRENQRAARSECARVEPKERQRVTSMAGQWG